MDEEYSNSSLLCQETEGCLDVDGPEEVSVHDGLDEEYLRAMFDWEIVCCSGSTRAGSSGMECPRLEAVTWMIKSGDSFGFRLKTTYLSVMYFDRFLAKRSIDSEKPWAIWLLVAACFSLAAKMEESTVPKLSSLQNQSGHYYFSSQMIRRMELLVLNTLEWRLRLVTPFVFLNYFAAIFHEDHHRSGGEITSRSVEIILSTMRGISLLDRRPSTIAAAAAAAASSSATVPGDENRSEVDLESKLKSSLFRNNLDIDGVLACYSQMKMLGKQHQRQDDDDEEVKMDRSEEWTTPTAISLPMGQANPVAAAVIPEISAITREDSSNTGRRRRAKRKSPSGDEKDDVLDPHFRGSPDCKEIFGD